MVLSFTRKETVNPGMNSRDNYNRHSEKEEMIGKLEIKLKNAKTPQERESIMECIRTLEE